MHVVGGADGRCAIPVDEDGAVVGQHEDGGCEQHAVNSDADLNQNVPDAFPGDGRIRRLRSGRTGASVSHVMKVLQLLQKNHFR